MGIINVRLLTKVFVLNKEGKVLLLQRSRADDVRPLGWDLPGGNVDHGEDPNEAILRELEEETGLAAKNFQVFYVGMQNESHYIVTLFYKATAVTTDVKLSHEHEQCKWVRPEEIIMFDMPEKYVKSAQILAASGS